MHNNGSVCRSNKNRQIIIIQFLQVTDQCIQCDISQYDRLRISIVKRSSHRNYNTTGISIHIGICDNGLFHSPAICPPASSGRVQLKNTIIVYYIRNISPAEIVIHHIRITIYTFLQICLCIIIWYIFHRTERLRNQFRLWCLFL